MIAGTALSRSVSFVAQIVLAWLLSPEDFGVYAIAIGFGSLAGLLRDGGVRKLIVQSQSPYERLAGPTFWMALAVNLLAGVLLFCGAPLAADFYGRPQLQDLLWVLALFQPMGTFGSVLSAKLLRDGDFNHLAMLRTASSILRYCAAISFALLGLGAMSFVLPMPLVAVAEGAMGFMFTREHPWSFAPRVARWRSMWRKCSWIVLGGASIGIYNTGIGVVIGRFVPASVVGAYFLASQAVIQIGAVLSDNIDQVLFSEFSRRDGEVRATSLIARRSLGVVSLAAAFVCVLLAVCFPYLEALVWHGKWAAAVAPVQILAVTYPPVVSLSVALAVLESQGAFRTWALGLAALATGALFASGAGAVLERSAVGVAIGVGSLGAVGSLALIVWIFGEIGVGWKGVSKLVVTPWAAATICGVAAEAGVNAAAGGNSPLLVMVMASAIYSALLIATFRFVLPEVVADTVALLPSRLRTAFSAVLGLGRDAS